MPKLDQLGHFHVHVSSFRETILLRYEKDRPVNGNKRRRVSSDKDDEQIPHTPASEIQFQRSVIPLWGVRREDRVKRERPPSLLSALNSQR